ncbi:MAG: hypothetical protein E7076_03745 [Bacteroidales bacterium]|nr:hypothetical protein [Bacteroidales bacterium]
MERTLWNDDRTIGIRWYTNDRLPLEDGTYYYLATDVLLCGNNYYSGEEVKRVVEILKKRRNDLDCEKSHYTYDEFLKKFGKTDVPGYAMLTSDGKAIYAKNENVEELVQNGAILKRMG